MADEEPPSDSKLTRTKKAWAERGHFLTGQATRPHSERLPPGQHLTNDWPVLDLGNQPDVPQHVWRLDVSGAVEHRLHLDWKAFEALPRSSFTTDIHCVTTWSRYDNRWDGVSTRDLMELAQPRQDAAFVMLSSSDGYTTNLPLTDFAAEQAMLVTHWNGAPLTREHGGPVRLVVPHLYFWKSAKWLKAIAFLTADQAGFWEQNGYHMRGDPWAEQRYSDD